MIVPDADPVAGGAEPVAPGQRPFNGGARGPLPLSRGRIRALAKRNTHGDYAESALDCAPQA